MKQTKPLFTQVALDQRKPIFNQQIAPVQSVGDEVIVLKQHDEFEPNSFEKYMVLPENQLAKIGLSIAIDKQVYNEDISALSVTKTAAVVFLADILAKELVNRPLFQQIGEKEVVSSLVSDIIVSTLVHGKFDGKRDLVRFAIPEMIVKKVL